MRLLATFTKKCIFAEKKESKHFFLKKSVIVSSKSKKKVYLLFFFVGASVSTLLPSAEIICLRVEYREVFWVGLSRLI